MGMLLVAAKAWFKKITRKVYAMGVPEFMLLKGIDKIPDDMSVRAKCMQFDETCGQ
ncbi:MAG: hypothetical protein KJ670_11845 [Alphaproteobacteria bacterium]|nr:hypothetical protein [Alphaproteobacteria bacterium]MBU4052087.1 hypothetical protein [Alphaproteobacteria bacterium]MBU4089399.1 hypothetical protein [Alphaproteobacteria bacterium]MBU4156420.1 hypothetical protein [Alphaproteobacteria bacterium]